MKVLDIMSPNPVCCLPTDSAQSVAALLRDHNVGSLPVVNNKESGVLIGMVTDRDLCCSVIAGGLDPRSTKIDKLFSHDVVTCRDGENVDKCERAMQDHQVRRIPIVDAEGRCIGIVSQADLALKEKQPEKVQKTIGEISKPEGSGGPNAG